MAHATADIDVTLTSAPPELVRTSVSLMLGLTAVTFGLYYPVWFLRQRVGINRLNPTLPIRQWPFVLLCVMHVAWVLLLVGGVRVPSVGGVRVTFVVAAVVAALWAFTVVQCLSIRRAIEQHAGVVLSTPATVGQGAFYLQYVINTALLIELSPEAIAVIERSERLRFEESLTAATPHVFVMPALIAMNCVMFAVVAVGTHSLSAPSPEVALRFGADYGPLATHGQWWRLLTSTFVHFGVPHLLVNMLVLWRVGRTIERAYGNLGFAVLYGLAGLGGALASVYWQPQIVSAGASGAIFGLFGGLLAFVSLQHQTIPERTASAMTKNAGAFIVYNVLSGLSSNLTAGAAATSRIDVAAHLGGLAAGFVAGLALAMPLDYSRRSSRWLRSALTAVLGLAATAVIARSLPIADDLAATLRRIDTLERQLGQRYASVLSQLREKKMPPEQFADVVEKELLPPWTDSRRVLNGLHVDGNQDLLIRRTVDFMTLRADVWRLTAEGIRKNDAALLVRGREDDAIATQIVNRVRGRAGEAVLTRFVGGLKSPGSRGVAGAQVSLVCNSYMGTASRSATYVAGCKTPHIEQTDSSGRFVFWGVPTGLYTLSTRAASFRDVVRDVEIDGSTQVAVTLVPIVDEFLVAMQKLSTAEKRTIASYNNAVNGLRARTVTPEEFTRIVEKDIVPEWMKVLDSMVLVDLTPARQAAAATVREYASLRIEAFETIARAVGTNNIELMKQGTMKQTEAARLMKNLRIAN